MRKEKILYIFTFLAVLIIPQVSILYGHINEPPKPYNFYNYGPDGEQYCWFLSELQLLYRVKPIHDLLDMLDQSKSKTIEAFKFAQVLKQVFKDMGDESKFQGLKRYFPEILRQISRDADVQKMLDAKKPGREAKMEQWNSKENLKAFFQDHPEKIYKYYRDVIKAIKYRNIQAILNDFKNPNAGYLGVLLFFIKNLHRAFPGKKTRELLDLVFFAYGKYLFPSNQNGGILPQFFVFIDFKIWIFSVTGWDLAEDYPKGFSEYKSRSEKIIIKGKTYDLVAMVLTGSPNGYDHEFALIKYGNVWYKYDSFYGGKDPEPLHGSLPEILNAQYNFMDGKNLPQIFLYQEADDLYSQLEKLKYSLETLKEKLIRLKKQLDELKEKLIS